MLVSSVSLPQNSEPILDLSTEIKVYLDVIKPLGVFDFDMQKFILFYKIIYHYSNQYFLDKNYLIIQI